MAAFDLATATDPAQLGLLDHGDRERRLETTLDRIAERFGADAIRRAGDVGTSVGPGLAANLDFLDEDDAPER